MGIRGPSWLLLGALLAVWGCGSADLDSGASETQEAGVREVGSRDAAVARTNTVLDAGATVPVLRSDDAGGGSARDAAAADAALESNESDSSMTPIDSGMTPEDASLPTETSDSGSVDAARPDASVVKPDAGPVDSGPQAECFFGASESRPCGNCGQQRRTCYSGQWGDWGSCIGEGPCAPGTIQTTACGSDIAPCHGGTRTRTCEAACVWGRYSACAGSGYVAGAPEICANGKDENCNGRADEGCSCDPVSVAGGGSFPVDDYIRKLVADPKRCLVYGLEYEKVVVIDTAAKNVLAAIPVPQASDMDLSPNGQWLVLAHGFQHEISMVDTQLFALADTIPVSSDPYDVEVDDHAVVYYSETDQSCAIRRVDFAAGIASDTVLFSDVFEPDLELSSDGRYLYVGVSGISSGNLNEVDVSMPSSLMSVDHSEWDEGLGFPDPPRALVLAPGGQHVYYGDHRMPGDDLSFAMGAPASVYAESAAGTFAVASNQIFDAVTLHQIASLTPAANAAALANHDRELWWYSNDDQVHYANVDKLLAGFPLGKRELSPGPLASYTLSRLLRDPTRNRLYAIDSTQNVVLVIDGATLKPQLAIAVGTAPSDLAIDAAGHYLFVGHKDAVAIARIDLVKLVFDAFLQTPRVPAELEVLSGGRLAMNDYDQWTTPAIVDQTTGAVLATNSPTFFRGMLSSSADGNTLFIGEGATSSSNMYRYDVSTNAFTPLNVGIDFRYPAQACVALPDGTAVYYANALREATSLNTARYSVTGTVELVTPDGRLVTTSTSVIRVADGTVLGALPTSSEVQAVSPDSKTLYVVNGGAITTVDLTAY